MEKENQCNNRRKQERMMSVWEWSAIVLGTYGFLIFIAGNLLSAGKSLPENPSLWWGAVMIAFSIIIFLIGRKEKTMSKVITKDKNTILISTIIYLLCILSGQAYSQKTEDWEFFHPDPSLESTGGLFRVVSPRTINFRTFSIGTYFGYFNTPDNKVIVISREHFALKEQRQQVYFEKFNSYGFYNYINISGGLPQIDVGGIISSDISISMRNSSVFLENQMRGGDLAQDNAQVLGDVIITPKISYLFEAKDLSFSLWPKIILLSQYRKPEIGAISWATGFSALYDFDERIKSETLSLINPKLILSVSYNFDNSKVITKNKRIPPYAETQIFIEPYNHIDFGLGVEAGNSKRGIGKFLSGFVEWSFMQYTPIPQGAKFSDMPMFISTGIRIKPIPLISEIIRGIPEEIREFSFFAVGDFSPTPGYVIPFPIGPDVILRNSPVWRLFLGMNIIWAPWEKAPRIISGEGGRIRMKVVDEVSGSPIEDAIISYPGLEVSPQATDRAGDVLSYELPEGEWSVAVRKEGYEIFSTKIALKKGEVKDIQIKLKKVVQKGAIYGQVSSSDGKVLAARIEIEGLDIPPTFSNPQDGKFEITLPPGTHKIKISSQNYNPSTVDITLAPGEKKRLDIILEPIEEYVQKGGEQKLKEKQQKIIIEKATNRILIPEKILFETEKPDVLKVSVDTLRELAEFIQKEVKNKKIRIEVHTDPIKDPNFDRELTQKRAEKIAEILSGFGVPRQNLIPIGKGSDFPITTNETPEGRSINRRVDFILE
jgi:outer membrane protein OmpA-like peptidoglycan-associated protein